MDENCTSETVNKIKLPVANGNSPKTEKERLVIIKKAAKAYEKYLDALGFDWRSDPNSSNTPMRVAKAFVNDIARGCYDNQPDITAFPNDGYDGIVAQCNIPVKSLCSHHHLAFTGVAHVAYIPSVDGKVIGLSKLNRIVDFYSRRPNIQESLTKQIHDHIDRLCIGNRGVAVVIESQHNCVKCRGIKQDSVMKTSQMSGYFWTNEVGTRQEFFNLIDQSRY